MGVQIIGQDLATLVKVDSTFNSMRVTNKPIDHGALGHYSLSANIPLVVTQAANGTLFSFRWGDATRLCVINSIRIESVQTGAATATIFPVFSVFAARTFTASDTVGTALTLTGNSFKKRTNMGTTLVTDIRQSAVAAGLTVGTRTLDASPILQMTAPQIITTPGVLPYIKQYDMRNGPDHPLALAQNEGFIVQGPSIVYGAAGTSNLIVDVEWTEVTAF